MHRATFAFCLLLAACHDATRPALNQTGGDQGAAAEREEFELAIGDSAVTTNPLGIIRVTAVFDSRCPVDMLVLCVWEGEAAVELRLHFGPPGSRSPEWNDTLTTRHAVSYGADRVLRLLALTPEPRSDWRIPPEAYRARLVLEDNPTGPATTVTISP